MGWKRRYFVLEPKEKKLKYFRRKGDTITRGEIPLGENTLVLKAGIRDFCIEITNKSQSFFICTQSSQEFFEWFERLLSLVKPVNSL